MSYEITLNFAVKTLGQTFTHSEMEQILKETLWNVKEFRDVQIIAYDGDTEEDKELKSNNGFYLINDEFFKD
jgi:hypothetical protein